MINIQEKVKCSGCKACVNACPTQCIDMRLDDEGFMYPYVDTSRCIDCGLCNQSCPVEQQFSKNDNNRPDYYAAYNKNIDVIRESSSGGIFWLVAQKIISEGGVVYGAELLPDFNVAHGRSDTLKECQRFKKSKYLQSDIGYNYKLTKQDLEVGKTVLFSGTPCQVAGLYTYLSKEYVNLITCDVVCHGVPSKTVFDKYISELNQKMNDEAISIVWRDKRDGWGPNKVSIKFKSGKELVTTSQNNSYQKGFLDNLYLRPICYECPFAKLPRNSDISLADFWGYDGKISKSNENRGLSLVIVSSKKGKGLFESIMNKCITEVVSEKYAMNKSRHSYLPPKKNRRRMKFYNELKYNSFIDELSQKYIYLSNSKKYLDKLIHRLSKIKSMINRI